MLLFWNAFIVTSKQTGRVWCIFSWRNKVACLCAVEEGCVQVCEGISEYPVNKVTRSAICDFY